jgi:Fe-S cluster assembly protein SufB
MAKNQPNESESILDAIVTTPYKYGFKTNLETEDFEKGLNTKIIEKISSKKNEPKFLKTFRDKAFASWKKMKSPLWAYLNIPEIDYDNIQYYSVPKTKKKTGKFR